MSEATTTGDKPYTIVGAPLHVRRWDDLKQAVVDGWEIAAQWAANGSVIRVFVPDTEDVAARADQLIRFQGEQLDALHGAA